MLENIKKKNSKSSNIEIYILANEAPEKKIKNIWMLESFQKKK